MGTNRDGFGVCYYLNGNVFCGQWTEDRRHGQGVMFYGDGCIYEGQWSRNARHGEGTFKRPGQWTYTGSWKDGKRCGWGKMEFSCQTTTPDECSAALPKIVRLDYVRGNLIFWHGFWKRNRPLGEGTGALLNGGVYQGVWVTNLRRDLPHDHYSNTSFTGTLNRRIGSSHNDPAPDQHAGE